MSYGPVVDFACPVCGRIRPIAERGARRIRKGETSGECRPGEGCRARVTVDERYRRFWLKTAGVTELEIRRAGGAVPYVLEFGLPAELAALAGILPHDAELETSHGLAAARGHRRRVAA